VPQSGLARGQEDVAAAEGFRFAKRDQARVIRAARITSYYLWEMLEQ